MIKASAKRNKKEKKKEKRGASSADNEDGDATGEDEASVVPKQAAVQMTAEELADEEWGPSTDKKGKKGKKGKKANENVEGTEVRVCLRGVLSLTNLSCSYCVPGACTRYTYGGS